MKAMILAAGVGSRLDPLTRTVPKPLVPIVNKPVMEYLVDLLKQHGFDEIVVNVHYLGSQIEGYFGDGSRWGVRITWQREEELWGDAGSMKRAEPFLSGGTFLVIGGDDLTDMDLGHLLKTHRDRRALATIALSLVDDPSEYGIVQMDEESRITRFLEKPKGEVIFSNTANTGVYMFEPEVFELIPHGVKMLFGRQLFPLLLDQGLPLYGHLTAAYWRDVGNLAAYQQTHADVLAGLVRAPMAMPEARKGVWIGEGAVVDPTADVGAPVAIGARTRIEAGARVLENSVLGAGCVVERGATVRDSILWDGAVVMSGTHLERCVVGAGCRVQSAAAIFNGIVLGAPSADA